jgi:hypothetical protein
MKGQFYDNYLTSNNKDMLLCIANLACIEMHAWMKFTSYQIPFVFDNSTNFFVCSIPVTGILSGLTSPI